MFWEQAVLGSNLVKEVWNPCLVVKLGTPNEFANFSKTVQVVAENSLVYFDLILEALK